MKEVVGVVMKYEKKNNQKVYQPTIRWRRWGGRGEILKKKEKKTTNKKKRRRVRRNGHLNQLIVTPFADPYTWFPIAYGKWRREKHVSGERYIPSRPSSAVVSRVHGGYKEYANSSQAKLFGPPYLRWRYHPTTLSCNHGIFYKLRGQLLRCLGGGERLPAAVTHEKHHPGRLPI